MEDKDRGSILGIGDSKCKGPEVVMSLGVCREEGSRAAAGGWAGLERQAEGRLQPSPLKALKTVVKNLHFILNSEESCERVLINK